MPCMMRIALDWTPNGNHVGIFVALAKGWYKGAGLDIELLSPHQDNYSQTPASKVLSGVADVAIGPSETVISHHHACRPAGGEGVDLVSVAALLQQDDSAIVTLKSSGIDSMKKLQNKRYGSYGARYEGRIVKQMIQNDGGTGEYEEVTPEKLGLWNTVVNGTTDATWIFMSWEGEEAKMKGIDLNVFPLKDYGVHYGYPLVMFAKPDKVRSEARENIASFLRETARGYEFAVSNKDEAAALMIAEWQRLFPEFPMDEELVRRSVAAASSTFLDGQEKWGTMTADRWDSFLVWLSENGFLTNKMQSRNPQKEHETTLDGLRQGDAGEKVDKAAIPLEELFVSDLLQ
ncbi:Formylaminopyrimidine-binding protein [Picochlorum sp. SENEW3]|nr:Formylaminopyrimidine-binding protein [Picochlorum sp. SENEW3]